MRCPQCNKLNPVNAKYCRSCQFPLADARKATTKMCPKCNKTYDFDARYCTKCQCELVVKDKSNASAMIIRIAVLLAIVSLSMIALLIIYPKYGFNTAIKNNDSQKLAIICQKHPDLLEDNERKEKYNHFISECVDKYIDGTTNYNQVSSDFENFHKINRHLLEQDILNNTKEKQDIIEKFHSSRLAFETAEESFDNHEYQNAEVKYSEVIKEDEKYYSIAQEKLNDMETLKNSYLVQAREKSSSGDYDGSLEILTEALTYFGYDEEYSNQYYNEIADSILKESDYLMGNNTYFSSDYEKGAFNLVYSYLNNEHYSDNEILKEKLNLIAEKSESSEISLAEKELSLINRNNIIDRCAATAAEDYYHDTSIQESNSYILSLCGNNDEVQNLISNIPESKKVKVALISDIAMTAEDFSKTSKEKIDAYSGYTWNYTGIGRYYSKENKTFSWAVIIIYEDEME